MSTTKFFPPITAILPVDSLPNELGFVKTGLTNILSRIYFRDLQYSQNDRGDSAFYSLSIVSLNRLDIEILGTGIFLILNPSHGTGASVFSEFPITVSYRWPILGYVRQFNLETFSFQAGDIFDLALRVLGVTERQLVERALNLFVPSASPIDTFVDDINAFFGTNIPHPSPTSTDPLGDVLEAIDTTADINGAGGAVFALYLLDALNDESTRDRISTFFEEFFDGQRIEDYIKQLLKPDINATLELSLAIEFPRNVLVPLTAVGGEPITDPTVKTWLTFDPGSFYFSTSRGIGLDKMLEVTLNHPSRIAGTTFGISLDKAKLDISRTTNIPEATADGRPVDFVGVYIENASLSFPAVWNHNPQGSTGVIRGKNLLIGTGGISGTLSIEALTANHASPVVKVRFGTNFSISLDKFTIKLKQNAITDSLIEGTLMIPGFKDANNKPAEIRIKVALHQNGDFDVTASEDDGFKEIKCGDIFTIKLKSVFCGKKGDDFYLGVSGSLKFTVGFLDKLGPIEVEKMIIHSDGRFEIEGGNIPLPRVLNFPIGPATVSISAIGLGSHDQNNRKYRYFGFDGGVNVNPGGVSARGNGIRFYFTVDDGPGKEHKHYFEIKSLGVDMVIPFGASKETATALISGFLSLGGEANSPIYEGGIKFSFPKLKMTGAASMKYSPKYPAFIIDATVTLASPIQIGATRLGIYDFRGIIGFRYIASKEKIGLSSETNTWFDYYKKPAGVPVPHEGISLEKFDEPNFTGKYKSAFSIGAGVSVADTVKSGEMFSSKLFLLLSSPGLIYLEGKANILGERIGIDPDEKDPPFSAVLAISPQSIELGFGVEYQLPRDGIAKGRILDLHAEMRAAFFFKNSSAWYMNFGTDTSPSTARILSMFDASAYLMLSASGIRVGASVTFGFDKSYAGGAVKASVGVYISVSGFISFHGPQIGGTAMLGGHVDVSLFKIGFHISIDTSLSVEAPKPFYVQGSVNICVGVKFFKKKIEKCFDVEFKWVKDPTAYTVPVLPLQDTREPNALPPANATNMLSGETFDIAMFGTTKPSPDSLSFTTAVIPLDTWIDFEFLKGMTPSDQVKLRIGSLSGLAPANHIDLVPPGQALHKVKHEYSLKAIEIRAYDGHDWVEYRPYKAMMPPGAMPPPTSDPATYKDGFWQNTGTGFNKLRLLAETSLSYVQQGEPEWYTPEQFGITSSTMFCPETRREKLCLQWVDFATGTRWPDGSWKQYNTVMWSVMGGPGTVVNWIGPVGIPHSLVFANEASAHFIFNKPCAEVSLRLTTFSTGAIIRFYKRQATDERFAYTLVETRSLTQIQLLAPVEYNNPEVPIAKVEIDPLNADPATVYNSQVKIDSMYKRLYEGNLNPQDQQDLLAEIALMEQGLARLLAQGCTANGIEREPLLQALPIVNGELSQCKIQLALLQAEQEAACGPPTAIGQPEPEVTERCEELTRELESKLAECRALSKQAEAINQFIEFIDMHGPVLPPDGFPCSTLVHEACCLSLEDYEFNVSIPGQNAIDEDYGKAIDAIEGMLTCIWRPDTKYHIALTVNDKVSYQEDFVPPLTDNTFYFGFCTGGPVGYFHTEAGAGYLNPPDDSPEKYILTNLKGYIDYARSYPEASGQLTGAKPLFYEDARILLFFIKRYVYHFFGDWPEYQTLPAITGSAMQVVIIDPAANAMDPDSPVPPTDAPQAVTSWNTDDHPRIPEDISVLTNLRYPELLNSDFERADCVPPPPPIPPGGHAITPASVFAKVTPEFLKPLKLYTAVINNVYKEQIREVYRYGFQTSRYADFEAQVNSYHLNDGEGHTRDAFFPINLQLTMEDIDLMFEVVTIDMTSTRNIELAGVYADPFDRLVEGVLKLKPLDAPISTEFNIVRDSETGAVIAVWIRNPEPFSDPKLPDEVLPNSVRVMNGNDINVSYKMLFSKDCSQVFVMHESKRIPDAQLVFRFAYIEWDGSQYVERTVITTDVIDMLT